MLTPELKAQGWRDIGEIEKLVILSDGETELLQDDGEILTLDSVFAAQNQNHQYGANGAVTDRYNYIAFRTKAQVLPTWQPIESAPKDGTFFAANLDLNYFAYAKRAIEIGENYVCIVNQFGISLDIGFEATHWQSIRKE